MVAFPKPRRLVSQNRSQRGAQGPIANSQHRAASVPDQESSRVPGSEVTALYASQRFVTTSLALVRVPKLLVSA